MDVGPSVDIIESKIGYRPKACILCEKDETLRYLVGEKHGISVDQIWQHSSKGGGAFYYAKDVDNLFVDNARLLREFAALCSDCHFFVIGGSPCTDLTYAGGDQGLLGICGPASVFFFTIHLALHLLTTVIPSNRIRFLVENAGSMRIEHFRFIRACLGLKHLQKNDLTWCTSALSPAKRSRIFSRTIPLMKLWNRKSTMLLMLLGHMTGALFFFKKEVHYVKSTYCLSCALSEQSVTLLFVTVGQAIIQLLYCGVSPTGALVIDLLF